MIYLQKFFLPTLEQEEDHAHKHCAVYGFEFGNDHPHAYPYGIFPYKRLSKIELSDITIFYGGNGSGKSTLLNLIAESLKLPRITPYNRSKYFVEYVDLMCSHKAIGGTRQNTVPNGSAIFTSDDVFYGLIDRRVENEMVEIRRDEKMHEYWEVSQGKKQYDRFESLDDYDRLLYQMDQHRKTMTQFVNKYAGETRTPDSNGEYAMNFFRTHFCDNCLYLLDEPENSLSPKYQLQLVSLLQEYSRFFGCQFIISTHSPFVMSLKGALIYDLDSIPVITKPWWELENMKVYYNFFSGFKNKFEK